MLAAFGLSDPGCVRPNNEDYFISDPATGIFILADGMGGANAGEFASRLSAETLHQYLLRNNNRDGGPTLLESGFVEANLTVREAARANPNFDGMGTTLVALKEGEAGSVDISSVGDSRAYIFSEDKLHLLTHDQTWVAEIGPRLGLGEEVLKKHPMRHVLTMAIGSTDQLRIFSVVVQLRPGDQILLCSDGLHGVLAEKTLQETLNSEKTLPDKCHYLVEAAKLEGGPDNVTVLLVQLV